MGEEELGGWHTNIRQYFADETLATIPSYSASNSSSSDGPWFISDEESLVDSPTENPQQPLDDSNDSSYELTVDIRTSQAHPRLGYISMQSFPVDMNTDVATAATHYSGKTNNS
ncbi:hypothetical protein L6452_43849 [Arctium lappa]|uniref:Uncharacterized protein n=1 Tax=Arctium lappa TaxID=4217 RepID=A0ACB8XE95_ARCLA|nr:hypothetical protein L6452_43849 [Arctium lappa]